MLRQGLNPRATNVALPPTRRSSRNASPPPDYVFLPARVSGDALNSYWKMSPRLSGEDHPASMTKVQSRSEVIPVGLSEGVAVSGTTLVLSPEHLREGIMVDGEEACERQVGTLHGQYAYVPSVALDGVDGRPSWLVGQLDSLEYLSGNGEGGVFFKDGLTGLEHEVITEGLDISTLALIPRAVAAIGVFDSSLVSRNRVMRVR